MIDRVLYESKDRLDGIKSLFLFVGNDMYVCARFRGRIEDDEWYDKDCSLSEYSSEPADYTRMIDPVEVWK